MFGKEYTKDMPLEIFLRYLEPGISNIPEIRKSLFFIPDKKFVKILKIANERNLISINSENQSLFFSKKNYEVVEFVEKYNFIDEIEKYDNENINISKELFEMLKKINFFKENGYHDDISTALNKCMMIEKNGNDYSPEILNFRFNIKKIYKEQINDKNDDIDWEENSFKNHIDGENFNE